MPDYAGRKGIDGEASCQREEGIEVVTGQKPTAVAIQGDLVCNVRVMWIWIKSCATAEGQVCIHAWKCYISMILQVDPQAGRSCDSCILQNLQRPSILVYKVRCKVSRTCGDRGHRLSTIVALADEWTFV
jgi:hypothetical protein